MDRAQILSLPLLPVLIPLGIYSQNSATKTTSRYLEKVKPETCLTELNEGLEPLLQGLDHVDQIFTKFSTSFPGSKDAYWSRDNFVKYLNARFDGNEAVIACAHVLWRVFSYGARYPYLNAPPGSSSSDQSSEARLDRLAFRRGFALLVLQGFDVLDNPKNGRLMRAPKYKPSTDRTSRLRRIFFRSLSVTSESKMDSGRSESVGRFQRQDIRGTIKFTQPMTTDELGVKQQNFDQEFEAATTRLQNTDAKDPSTLQQSCIVPRHDLEGFIRLLLLLCPSRKRWRDGLFSVDKFQRSGDILHSEFSSEPEDLSRASNLARKLVIGNFGPTEEPIELAAFEEWCKNSPSCIFLFYQLWAALFTLSSINSPWNLGFSMLPISIANLLCLSNISTSAPQQESSKCFRDGDILHLQHGLQASELIIALNANSDLDEDDLELLDLAISPPHVLLIEETCIESNQNDPLDHRKGEERLYVFLVEKSHSGTQQKYEDGNREARYIWRSPKVKIGPTGISTISANDVKAQIVDFLENLLESVPSKSVPSRPGKKTLGGEKDVKNQTNLQEKILETVSCMLGDSPAQQDQIGQTDKRPTTTTHTKQPEISDERKLMDLSEAKYKLTALKFYRLPDFNP